MSLKARLASAAPRTATHWLRIEDDAKPRADLEAAQTEENESAIEVARAALEACYEEIRLVALPAQEWDDLVTEHPPSDEKAKKYGAWCDPMTLLPAGLARCVQDSDVTEEDWAAYVATGTMTPGEAGEALDKLVGLHTRTLGPELGKDGTGSRS